MIQMDIGGAGFRLDPAAISAIRYRVEYGDSIVNHLESCRTARDTEGRLLRMCHMMIPVADRPELLEFAKLAHKDKHFIGKAIRARDALLAPDERFVSSDGEPSSESFDEYTVLAIMAVAGVDLNLIYELPIMHLASIAVKCSELRDPDRKTYRKLTDTEMATLYPGAGGD